MKPSAPLHATLVFAAFGSTSLLPLVHGPAWFALEGITALSLALALGFARTLAPLAAYCTLAPLVLWFTSRWIPWPGGYALLLGAYVLVVRVVPSLRATPAARWLRRGRLGTAEWRLIGLVVSISSTALFGWFFLFQPDFSDLREMVPPNVPMWGVALGAIGFSMANAAVEETIWRGIFFESLEPYAGRWPALALQAASFGIAHIHGFPRGAVGICLAAIYGLMTGYIRVRAGGMLAPWVAHIFADLTIVFILATFVFR